MSQVTIRLPFGELDLGDQGGSRIEYGRCLDLIDGEISSILGSPLGFLRLLDHSVRPHQHIRRNRQTDLLSRFQINDELEFRRLFDWEISRFRTFRILSTYVAARANKSLLFAPYVMSPPSSTNSGHG